MLRALRSSFDVRAVVSDVPTYPARLAALSIGLLAAVRKTPAGRLDGAFAGFYGQPLALLLSRLVASPIILDAFVSTYDTLCGDRQAVAADSSLGRLAFSVDRRACAVAAKVVVDTQAHAAYFAQTFGVPAEKLAVIYLGHDPAVFRPDAIEGARASRSEGTRVIFTYGSYMPLHGAETIVRAAHLLAGERRLRFRLVGTGPTYRRVRQLAEAQRIDSIQFLDWLPYTELPTAIAEADICLGGPFGTTGKAQRVIAGKTYQFLAMGRPAILGDTPANRELFHHRETAWLCRPGDPEALAEAIVALADDPERARAIGSAGQALVRERCTPERLASEVAAVVHSACHPRAGHLETTGRV